MKPVVKILVLSGIVLCAFRAWADPISFEGPKDTIKGVRAPAVADHIDFNAEGYSNPAGIEEEMVVPLHFNNVPTVDYLLGLSDQNNWTSAGPDTFFKNYPFSHEAERLVAPWMVEHGQFDKNSLADLAIIVHEGGNPNSKDGGLWVGLNYNGQMVNAPDWSFHPTPCKQDPAIVATHLVNISRASIPTWIQVGDTDNDGDVDIVVSTTCGELHTFLNDGAGNFPPFASYVREVDTPAAEASSPFITSFVLKKFDGDNYPDIAAVAFSFSPGPAAMVLLGGSDGKFSANSFKVFDQDIFECFLPTHIIAADLNGDGLSDLAAACPFDYKPNVLTDARLAAPVLGTGSIVSGHVYIYLATAPTNFGLAEPNVPDQVLSNAVYFPISVAAGNFNSDAKLDLGVANAFDRDAVNHLHEGSVSFHDNADGTGKNYDDVLGATYAHYMGFHPTYGFTVEVNEDGRDDYAVSSYGSKRDPTPAIAAVPAADAFQVLVNTVPPDITVQEPNCSAVSGGEISVSFKVHDSDGGDMIQTVDVTVNPPVDPSKIVKSAIPAAEVTVNVHIPVAGASHITVKAKDSSNKESVKEWDYLGQFEDCGKTATECPAQPLEFEAFQGKMASLCAPSEAVGGGSVKWSQISGQALKFDVMEMKGLPPAAGSCVQFICAVDAKWHNYDVSLQYEVLDADGNPKFACPAAGTCVGAVLEGSGTIFRCSLHKASTAESSGPFDLGAIAALGALAISLLLPRKKIEMTDK
jgi:hypothetical protein